MIIKKHNSPSKIYSLPVANEIESSFHRCRNPDDFSIVRPIKLYLESTRRLSYDWLPFPTRTICMVESNGQSKIRIKFDTMLKVQERGERSYLQRIGNNRRSFRAMIVAHDYHFAAHRPPNNNRYFSCFVQRWTRARRGLWSFRFFDYQCKSVVSSMLIAWNNSGLWFRKRATASVLCVADRFVDGNVLSAVQLGEIRSCIPIDR